MLLVLTPDSVDTFLFYEISPSTYSFESSLKAGSYESNGT